MENINNYKTADLEFAATLYVMNIKMIEMENDGNKKIFVFDNKEKCNKIKMQYINGELRMDPKKLWEGLSTLKSLIYNL